MPRTDEYGTVTNLTIGDRNRSGLLEITDTAWDFNGTLRVTVRELIGLTRAEPLPIRAMRDLARRALSHPEHTRSARLIRAEHDPANGGRATFAVSRLDPRG